jgi:hypothetical protein
MAVETGVPHTVWLDDTRALMTAVRYVKQRNSRRR